MNSSNSLNILKTQINKNKKNITFKIIIKKTIYWISLNVPRYFRISKRRIDCTKFHPKTPSKVAKQLCTIKILNFAKRPEILPDLKTKNRFHQLSPQNSFKSGKTTLTPFLSAFYSSWSETKATVLFSTSQRFVSWISGPKRLNPAMFLVDQSGAPPRGPLHAVFYSAAICYTAKQYSTLRPYAILLKSILPVTSVWAWTSCGKIPPGSSHTNGGGVYAWFQISLYFWPQCAPPPRCCGKIPAGSSHK